MDKSTLHLKRREFFTAILDQLSKPPTKIDEILNQDKYYIKPNLSETVIDAESGDMAVKIQGKFFDKGFNVYYTLWQVGEALKIGVAIYDEDLQGAFVNDAHSEVYSMWGKGHDPNIDVSHDCVFYDWEFEVADLYKEFIYQEKFILGMKHMHFRVMKILYDTCHRIKAEKTSGDGSVSDVLNSFENEIKS